MAKDLAIKRAQSSMRTRHSSSSSNPSPDQHSCKRKHNKSTSSHSHNHSHSESSRRKKSKRTNYDSSSISDIHSSQKEVITPPILSESPGVASELRRAAKHDTRRKRERRGWAGLPDDIAERISGLLLAEDVTEYLRFRAVCHSWRESTAAPGNLERRFLPRNWIIIVEDSHGLQNRVQLRRCFLNISNGKYLHVDVPELFDGTTHKLLSMLDGLLVLMESSTSDMILLNPFTRTLTRFPALVPLFSIICPPSTRDIIDIVRLNLTAVNFASSFSSTIVISVRFTRVAYANPDDQKWVLMELDEGYRWYSTLFFQGRLFATSIIGELMQFVPPGGDEMHPEPQVITLIPSRRRPAGMLCNSLVEYGGDMLLASVYSSSRSRIHLFKVDVEKRRLVPTTINSSHALFLTPIRGLSISTSIFPTVKGNTISQGMRGGNYSVFVPEGDHYVQALFNTGSDRPFLLDDLFKYYCGEFWR